MADYFTQFSCILDVGTAENAERALDLYENAPEDEDGFRLSDGFLLTLEQEWITQLWISDKSTGPEVR